MTSEWLLWRQFIKQHASLKLILFLNQLNMTKYKNAILRLESHTNQLPQNIPNKQSIKQVLQTNTIINNVNPTIVMASVKCKKINSKHVFLMYSRIHNKLRLRFSTLFKAITLFKAYEQWNQLTKQSIPQQYIIIICLNISMKYEQIYPPKLKKVLPFLKMNSININDYWKYELAFIQSIHANLNLATPKTIIDSYLHKQQKIVYWYAYYLLELSFMEEKLAGFTLNQICLGITAIMAKLGDTLKNKKRLDDRVDEQRINYCSRVILKAKYKSTENESVIFKKYSLDLYGKVAQKIVYVQDS